MEAGVEEDDLERGLDAHREVEQDRILERGGQSDLAWESPDRPGDDLLRLGLFEAVGGGGDLLLERATGSVDLCVGPELGHGAVLYLTIQIRLLRIRSGSL